MATKFDIRESDRWYTNTDYTVKFQIFERDGVTPKDASTFASLSWLLKRRAEDPDASAVLSKASPTITVTGVFNIDPDVNTQLVEVPITDTDTVSVRKGAYAHELKVNDPGLETVLCSGSAILLPSAHRS